LSNFASLILMLGAVSNAGSMTGVSGFVRVSPAHPGPQRIGDSAHAPMAGAAVQARNADGKVVARAVGDAMGHFTIALPAGQYSVEVDVGGAMLPRCGSVDVVVHDGQLAQADMDCDSGMR
jgi:hypothetical protein